MRTKTVVRSLPVFGSNESQIAFLLQLNHVRVTQDICSEMHQSALAVFRSKSKTKIQQCLI